MAQGISQRNRLSIRDFNSDPAGAMRDLQRWANYLNFGRSGFEVQRSVSLGILTATGPDIAWDQAADDAEQWTGIAGGAVGSQSAFTVPPGRSGIYLFNFRGYFGAVSLAAKSVTPIATITRYLTGAQEAVGMWQVSSGSDRFDCTGRATLNDGDIITASIFNGTAGTITLTAVAAGAQVAYSPSFSCYRISLL